MARELRATDPDTALAIGKLRKPSVGVWAIDQLAVDHSALITELLAAGADARDAHQNAAAGTESREDLLAATERESAPGNVRDQFVSGILAESEIRVVPLAELRKWAHDVAPMLRAEGA